MRYHYHVIYDIRLHSIIHIVSLFHNGGLAIIYSQRGHLPTTGVDAVWKQPRCPHTICMHRCGEAFYRIMRLLRLFIQVYYILEFYCILRFCLLLDEDASGDAIRLLEVDIELRRQLGGK